MVNMVLITILIIFSIGVVILLSVLAYKMGNSTGQKGDNISLLAIILFLLICGWPLIFYLVGYHNGKNNAPINKKIVLTKEEYDELSKKE